MNRPLVTYYKNRSLLTKIVCLMLNRWICVYPHPNHVKYVGKYFQPMVIWFFVAHYFRIIPYLTFFAPPKERGGDYFHRCCRKHVVFSCVCSNSAPLGTTSETQTKSPKRRISALKLRKSQWNSQQVPASLGHTRYLMEHLVMNNRKKKSIPKKKLSKTAKFTQTAEKKITLK